MTGPGNESTFSVVVLSLELLISAVVECVGNDACVNIRVVGAGGPQPRELCGRTVLYSCRHRSVRTFASNRVSKISRSRSSARSFPLKDSMNPFSHGLPGSMNSVYMWPIDLPGFGFGLKPA